MNYRNLFWWITIAVVNVLVVYLLFFIKTESFQCLSNPAVYTIKGLEENNNAPVSCLCSVNKPNGATVLLTSKGFEAIRNTNPSNRLDINFSGLLPP